MYGVGVNIDSAPGLIQYHTIPHIVTAQAWQRSPTITVASLLTTYEKHVRDQRKERLALSKSSRLCLVNKVSSTNYVIVASHCDAFREINPPRLDCVRGNSYRKHALNTDQCSWSARSGNIQHSHNCRGPADPSPRSTRHDTE